MVASKYYLLYFLLLPSSLNLFWEFVLSLSFQFFWNNNLSPSCVWSHLINTSLICGKHEKQQIASRSSLNTEYKALINAIYEVQWLLYLLHYLCIFTPTKLQFFCDNWLVIYFANNHVFYEGTKHIKLNRHLVRDNVQEKNHPPYHYSLSQLGCIPFSQIYSFTLVLFQIC